MARYSSGNNLPLGHWNNLPIYLTTLVTAGMALALIGCAIMDVIRSPFADWVNFTMPLVPSWSFWRLISHVLVDEISFFTPFGLFFFYWVAVGIETHLGRIALGGLLLWLAITGPAVAIFWYVGLGLPSVTYGNYILYAGTLVAFATLYPHTEAFGWIPFKWVAFACIVCGSLMILAERQWLELAQLWASCAVAFTYVRQVKEPQYEDHVPLMARLANRLKRKPKFRVLPSPASSARRGREQPAEMDDIDPLLDKIAKSGMSSLTEKERAKLEKAREALIKKEGR